MFDAASLADSILHFDVLCMHERMHCTSLKFPQQLTTSVMIWQLELASMLPT